LNRLSVAKVEAVGPLFSDYERALAQARRDAQQRLNAAVTIHCPTCNHGLAFVTDTSPGLLWQQPDRGAGRDLLAQILAQHDDDTATVIVGDMKRWQRRVRRDIERIVDWCGAPDDDWQDGTPLLVWCCRETWAVNVPKLVARCRIPQAAGVRASSHRRVSVADVASRWHP
jgi:hypothetical protein